MTGTAGQPTGRALTILNEMVRAGVDRGVALQEVTRMGLPGAPVPALSAAQTAVVEALSAPARKVYDSWREVGHPHDRALEEVRASGVDADPHAAELSEVRSAVTFGRITQTEGARRVAAIKARPAPKAGALSEASYDARSARVFGRPGAGA